MLPLDVVIGLLSRSWSCLQMGTPFMPLASRFDDSSIVTSGEGRVSGPHMESHRDLFDLWPSEIMDNCLL